MSYLENPTVANIFRSSNPVLKDKVFTGQIAAGDVMTVQGTVNKTGILLLCVVATAAWTWGLAHSEQPEAALPWMLGGLFGGLITCLVTVFKKEWSPLSAPIYALFEGLVLGGISALFEKSYPGIAVESVALTFGVLFVLLLAYKTGLIRATRGFVLGIVCATGAIALVYAASMFMGLFGFRARRKHGRAKVHGVVRRVRFDAYFDLAVPGNTAAAWQGSAPLRRRFKN